MTLSYVAVTPARNEAESLARLAECMRSQTHRPAAWVVVDDSSTDGTPTAAPVATTGSLVRDGATAPGAPVVRAFHAGLAALPVPGDVVVKLDADVSFEPDFFERLMSAFAADPSLGIAGGTCLEDEDGEWRATRVTGDHVRGAVRAYRRECLEAVLPLEERMGWDGIDELKAAVCGWRTGPVPGLDFRHHRPVGARDGTRPRRWIAMGRGAHYMGYRPSYLVLRSVFNARRDPAALAMVWGYLAAATGREPRYGDPAVVRYLRDTQRIRNLRSRAKEVA